MSLRAAVTIQDRPQVKPLARVLVGERAGPTGKILEQLLAANGRYLVTVHNGHLVKFAMVNADVSETKLQAVLEGENGQAGKGE